MILNNLIRAWRNLEDSAPVPVELIIGNESSDLDSIVSALSYSCYRSNVTKSSEIVHVPVINSHRKRLETSFEIKRLFNLTFCSERITDKLIFLEDVSKAISQGLVKQVSIVDHSIPSSSILGLNIPIVSIVSHTPGSTYPSNDSHISKAGSCCTLVALIWRDKIIENKYLKLSYEHCLLLTVTILIDTHHLDTNYPQTTSMDEEAVAFLKIHGNLSDYSVEQIYNSTKALLMDDSGIPLDIILSKDYKSYPYFGKCIGISSVRWYFSGKDGILEKRVEFEEEIYKTMLQNNLNLFFIMTHFTKDDQTSNTRNMAICFRGNISKQDANDMRSKIVDHVKSLESTSLTPIELDQIPESLSRELIVFYFDQRNTNGIRKVFYPELLTVLKDVFSQESALNFL